MPSTMGRVSNPPSPSMETTLLFNPISIELSEHNKQINSFIEMLNNSLKEFLKKNSYWAPEKVKHISNVHTRWAKLFILANKVSINKFISQAKTIDFERIINEVFTDKSWLPIQHAFFYALLEYSTLVEFSGGPVTSDFANYYRVTYNPKHIFTIEHSKINIPETQVIEPKAERSSTPIPKGPEALLSQIHSLV